MPYPNFYDTDEILIEINETESWKIMVEDIDTFLISYEDKSESHFNLSSFGPCHANSSSYGYANKKPCVFLRLDHHKEWIPEALNFSNTIDGPLINFPNDMSLDLVDYIKMSAEQNVVGFKMFLL